MPLPPTAAKVMIDADTGRPFVISGPNDSTPQVLKTSDDRLADTIRSLIAAASVSNSVINRPWAKAPDWEPNKAYFQGTVVRGIGEGNTGNLYLCAKDGTSGPATGPTGRGNTGIIDNTTAWLYFGPVFSELTVPLWSTVNPAVAGDVMDGHMAISLYANRVALGLTRPYTMSTADPVARVTGGLLEDTGGSVDVKAPNGGTFAVPVRNSSTRRWCAHFQTDSRKWLAFEPINNIWPMRFAIEVNGRVLSEGGMVAVAAQTAGGMFMLDMSRFPAGTKDVRIYGRDSIRGVVLRVHVADDELVWRPTTRSNLLMAFEGDSITQGGGLGPACINDWVETLVCRQLGIESWYNNAIGGTGAIATRNGTGATYLQRLPDLVALNPDIVLVGGFTNDSAYTQAEKRAAFLTYLQALRAALPKATLFVVGIQVGGGEAIAAGSNAHNTELDAKWAVEQLNDGNTCFIPLLTRSRQFPAVTTDGWFYQGTSASPFNDYHPTPRYYRSYAQVVVEAIREYFAAK